MRPLSPTPDAIYERLAPDRERWTTPLGELLIWQPRDDVLVLRARGHISGRSALR